TTWARASSSLSVIGTIVVAKSACAAIAEPARSIARDRPIARRTAIREDIGMTSSPLGGRVNVQIRNRAVRVRKSNEIKDYRPEARPPGAEKCRSAASGGAQIRRSPVRGKLPASPMIRSFPQTACVLCGAPGEPLYTDLMDRFFDAPGAW